MVIYPSFTNSVSLIVYSPSSFFFFFNFMHIVCVLVRFVIQHMSMLLQAILSKVKIKYMQMYPSLALHPLTLMKKKKIQGPSSSMCPSGSRGQTWSIPASSPHASNISPPPTFFLHSSWLQFGTNNATQEMSFRALWVNHDKLKSDSFTNGVETLFPHP